MPSLSLSMELKPEGYWLSIILKGFIFCLSVLLCPSVLFFLFFFSVSRQRLAESAEDADLYHEFNATLQVSAEVRAGASLRLTPGVISEASAV